MEILGRLEHTDKESLLEAVDPILNYVDGNIVTLSQSLLSLNFARMLQLFWNLIIQALLAEGGKLQFKSLKEQEFMFFRILELVPVIREYFENGDGGLNEDELKTAEVLEAYEILKLYTTGTNEMIAYFYSVRGWEQVVSSSCM